MTAPSWYHWEGDTLIVECHVQPRASRDHVAGLHGAALKVCLTAPPVDGKANDHLMRYAARLFRVKPAQIRLLRGAASRRKTLAVTAPPVAPEAVLADGEGNL